MRQDAPPQVDGESLAESTDFESSDREAVLRDLYGVKYVCPFKGCKLQFKRQDRLDMHVFSHTNIRKYVCSHANCTKSYATDSHLRRHIRTNHTTKENKQSEILIICEHPGCAQSFTNSTSMRRHMKNKHVEPKAHKCDKCDQEFGRKDQLKRHYVTHTGQMPHQCEHCSSGFANLKQYRLHLVSHRERKYKCEKCPEVFDKWSKLVVHRRTAHPIVCKVCEREFINGSCLRTHMAIHKEIKEVFACDVENCPKYYFHRRNLLAHIRNHHNPDAGFECDMCGTRLVTKQKLQLHLDWHMRRPDRQLVTVITLPEKRKPRKDRGIRKISTASLLTNIREAKTNEILEETDERITTIKGEAVDLEEQIICNDDVMVDLIRNEEERTLQQCDSDKELQDVSSGMEL